MALIYPLIIVTIVVRALAHLTTRFDWTSMRAWNSWPAVVGVGMGVALGSGSVTHFVEPQRSGLVAIVPSWFPYPELAITGTGVLEILLAAGMITPKSRRLAAVSTIVLLIAIFPANVVAAGGVDHPAAPDTPLLPRTILQIVFVGACFVASLPEKNADDGRARCVSQPQCLETHRLQDKCPVALVAPASGSFSGRVSGNQRAS